MTGVPNVVCRDVLQISAAGEQDEYAQNYVFHFVEPKSRFSECRISGSVDLRTRWYFVLWAATGGRLVDPFLEGPIRMAAQRRIVLMLL